MNFTILRTLLSVVIFFTATIVMSQTQQLSREEIAMNKAVEKVERYRLKLVDIKRDIESADSLYTAGEEKEKAAKEVKVLARDEIKAIEKKYKADSKPYKKMAKSKDRNEASDGRAQLKEITTKYKADLKAAQTKMKNGERDVSTAFRMMDKADKKLDLLKTKLKSAEKSYEEAEKALNEKKEND